VVGALPVFIGYAIFGMLLFAQYTARVSSDLDASKPPVVFQS
jgi:hypothetical protein